MAKAHYIRGKWRVQVRRAGHPHRQFSHDNKREAERLARAYEASLDLDMGGRSEMTIGTIVRRYRLECQVEPFGRNKLDVLRRIELHLDKVVASRLTVERVVTYIREDRGIRGVTASIDLTYLRSVLRVAKALWRTSCNPSVVEEAREILNHIGSLGRSKERDRRPTEAELAALKGWFAERSASLTPDLVDFILDSCFRPPSEIVGLRWADLNEADKTILIRDRKDPQKKLGNHQVVPLLGRCFDIIQRQPRISDLIFPVNGKTWSSIFPRACRELGIQDLRLYDLRHEAASRLAEAGYTIPEMMLVAGWKDPKQAMRYIQLRAKDLHRKDLRKPHR